jgi:hypothetical protein
MRTIVITILVGILTIGGVQASDKKKDTSPNQASVNASGKKWAPPPGRLSDATIASLTWDSDRKKPQQQMPGSFVNVNSVPEPSSLLLIGIGLIGVVASRRRKK